MAARHRPLDLTPSLTKSIAVQVAKGLPLNHAARLAGSSPRSLFRWLAKGRASRGAAADSLFVALLAAVKKAQAQAVARHVAAIDKASRKGTWQASAWYLERTHPEHFGTDRRELRELRKTLADLTARIARLVPPDAPDATPPNGQSGNPAP